MTELRSNEQFSRIFSASEALVLDADLDPISLPRRRRPAVKFCGPAEAYHADTVDSHFRQQFYSVIDTALNELAERFDVNKGGLKTYTRLENMFFGGEIESEIVTRYPELNLSNLEAQLKMFRCEYQCSSLEVARLVFKQMHPEVLRLFSQVCELLINNRIIFYALYLFCTVY